MNKYSIGDGDKQVSCPERYLADQGSEGTVVIWDPIQADIPVRVSVISITPKDPKEYEVARWEVIEKARKNGVQPRILNDKAVYSYRKPADEAEYFMHFFEVGMGNEFFIFSITVHESKESSEIFNVISNDVYSMIESLVLRKEGEQFDCCLMECEKTLIQDARNSLLKNEKGEKAWKLLQEHYDRALSGAAVDSGSNIGLVFGELLNEEVSAFSWRAKIDEYGRARSLDFHGGRIAVFPEAMIEKRLDRKEAVDFRDLTSGTIEMVESLYRKYQDEASA